MANAQRRARVDGLIVEFVAAEMVPNVDLCYVPGPERGDETKNNDIPATAMYFYKRPESSQKNLQPKYHPFSEYLKSEDSTKAVVKRQRHASACKCNSCSALQEITGCGICCKPLQGRSISNCTHCNNVMCTDCTKEMVNCAFCHKEKSVVNNPALELLLAYFTLPCRNEWEGCPEWLTERTRKNHEVCCTYKQNTCPLGNEECSWVGTVGQVLKHLEEVHDITPIPTQRITFQVADLLYQCRGKLGKVTIYLDIDDQLFTIRIASSQRKLGFSFRRLGYVRTVDESVADDSYGIWVNFKKVCVEDPEEKTAFRTFETEDRLIELNTNTFLGADESVADPIDFRLVTDITIKLNPEVVEEIPKPKIEDN